MTIPGLHNQGRVHNMSILVNSLDHARGLLLFTHSMFGCDTCSAFFGKGKIAALNLIRSSRDLAERMKVFYQPNASKAAIAAAGEEFILAVYNGSKCRTLDELRVLQYKKTVGKQKLDQKFDFRTLAPTSKAAEQHSFRVYLQVHACF